MQQKLDYIDALRGIAILLVLIVHVNQYGSPIVSYTLNQFIAEGNKGVQLFYVASAFTLYLSFQHKFQKEKSPIRNFFLRRFFRIAPMYYLGIIYYLYQDGLGARYWLGDATEITIANITANFLFLHGLNPYWITSVVHGGWSIAVEMMFYVIVPYLFMKVKNINTAVNLLLATLIVRAVLQLFFEKHQLIPSATLWHEYLYMYFPNQLPVFIVGILLYFVIIKPESLKEIKGQTLLALATFLFIHLCMSGLFLFPIHVIFSMVFLLLCVGLSKYHFKLLVNPIIIHIGKVSFSMYLVHFAVLYWLKEYNFVEFTQNSVLNYTIRFCVATSISVLIATLFYHAVELPFQQLGKKVIDRLERV